MKEAEEWSAFENHGLHAIYKPFWVDSPLTDSFSPIKESSKTMKWSLDILGEDEMWHAFQGHS